MSMQNEEIKKALKAYRKQIYEKNKDKIKQKNLEYYHANKDKINKKTICKCGETYITRNKDLHIKGKTHVAYLRGLKENIKKHKESSESSESSSTDDSTSSDEE